PLALPTLSLHDALPIWLVAEGFPEAWIEDPDLSELEAATALEPYHDRITWDAPIHSVDDIEALPFRPRTINVKPSRIGSVRRLLDRKSTRLNSSHQIIS